MAKVWSGLWHMSEDGISRKCYATERSCTLGYHSDSEAGSYNKFNDTSEIAKIKLPTPKRKSVNMTPQDKGRENLLRSYGVATDFESVKSEQVESHSTTDIINAGYTVAKESVTYALNHQDYETLSIEKTTESRAYFMVNGRRRDLNKDELEIAKRNDERFHNVESKLQKSDRQIEELKNLSNLATLRSMGKSKKTIMASLERNRNKDLRELVIISRNYRRVYRQEDSVITATLSGKNITPTTFTLPPDVSKENSPKVNGDQLLGNLFKNINQ